MQEGEQESFDFIRAQSADGRRRAAAQGGAASVELLEINKAPRWGEKKGWIEAGIYVAISQLQGDAKLLLLGE